jgi:hypothetical protein
MITKPRESWMRTRCLEKIVIIVFAPSVHTDAAFLLPTSIIVAYTPCCFLSSASEHPYTHTHTAKAAKECFFNKRYKSWPGAIYEIE